MYGFARLVDELGDSLERRPSARRSIGWRTNSTAPTAARRGTRCSSRWSRRCGRARCRASRSSRLIEANRVDQRVSRYETWEQLQGYCALSADPVGELVLGVFGARRPAAGARCRTRSAPRCSWPSTARTSPRTWPADGSTCPLRTSPASAADDGGPRRRARAGRPRCARCSPSRSHGRAGCCAAGAPLVGGRCAGRPRLRRRRRSSRAGGRRCDAIERAGYDVLAGPPRAGRRAAWRMLARDARRASRCCGAGEHACRERLRALRGDHARAGGELLLRHPPAAPRAAPGDVRRLRVRAARRRHRRRRRSPRREAGAPRRAGARSSSRGTGAAGRPARTR